MTWRDWFLEHRRGRRTILRYTRSENNTGASHSVVMTIIAADDDNNKLRMAVVYRNVYIKEDRKGLRWLGEVSCWLLVLDRCGFRIQGKTRAPVKVEKTRQSVNHSVRHVG